ncbi:MAG: 2-oxoacid:acceptor oxidoreductase subunit alpha [Phycisphaerae bacterium]
MDINIRIAGEAGQGVKTTGELLIGSFARMGLSVLASKSYMSRIRGGLNWIDVRIADQELFAPRDETDLLVALNDNALEVLRETVTDGGMIVYDGEEAEGAAAWDFNKIAQNLVGSKVMANTVAAGVIYAILGYDVEKLCDHLEKVFGKKGEEVVKKNQQCARKGVELADELAGALKSPNHDHAPPDVVDGATAIALGAATAGVKVVTAYPMTPGTATLTYLAQIGDRYGIIVEQAEDEIAAVNMVCGAAYAGVPAMAPTSGGGYALMGEGVSLAGIMELPIFLVDAQRPGPATGLPTRTGQQDLNFVRYSGHGEFPKAIFAPGTVHQSYELTRRGLEQAHKWQTPVILLTDQFLQDLEKNVEPLDETLRPIDRCIKEDAGADYKRYEVTESGVSPRAIPGGAARVSCDSDAHTEEGKITESLQEHMAQTDKRMRKECGLIDDWLPPEHYGPEDAGTLLVCWGSTYGPAREAVDRLNADGGDYAMLHFAQVWPINADRARQAIGDRKRVVMVEGNQTGQLAALLREQQVIGDVELLLRYDGLPLTAGYIVREVIQ